MKRLLLSLLAALAISLPLFFQEYIGDSCCRFLLSSKGCQAIINLHIEGLIEYLDNEEPKACR
ncbi:MAG: hypothetical protein IJQ61_04250 [Bacteroidales bacterium]|nr:hypothetical protein [Bacteroidales bacterium]